MSTSTPTPTPTSNLDLLQDTGRLLADVTEDLAIEILGSFTEEDYPHLGKTLDRLEAAADRLAELNIDVPFPVAEVLRNARGKTVSN